MTHLTDIHGPLTGTRDADYPGSEPLRLDASFNEAIDRACRKLPPDWNIEIQCENGYAGIELIGYDGEVHSGYDGEGTPLEWLESAIDAALFEEATAP